MSGMSWAAVSVALLVSLAALALSALLTSRYRQLHELVVANNRAPGRFASPSGPTFPAVGTPVPEFATFAADGARVDTNSVSQPGSVAVFLDTNCATCKDYLPEISGFLSARAADGPAPIAVISGRREEIGEYVGALPDGVQVVGQSTGELARAFGVEAFPTVLLFDEGRVSASGPRPTELTAATR